MNKIITILIGLIIAFAATAQPKKNFTDAEREAWMKEMQQYKIEYMVKKLELTPDQKTRFAPVLKRMDAEIRSVNEQARKMCCDIKKKGAAATELEQEKAAEAQFEVKAKEAQIEKNYYLEFRKFLSPAQMLKFKDAERDYMKSLMKKKRDGNEKRKK